MHYQTWISVPTSSSTTTSQDPIQSMLATKNRIIHRCFNQLIQIFIQSSTKLPQSILFDKLRQSIAKITTYCEIRSIASFKYTKYTPSSTSNVMRSIDFNKSYERFAIASRKAILSIQKWCFANQSGNLPQNCKKWRKSYQSTIFAQSSFQLVLQVYFSRQMNPGSKRSRTSIILDGQIDS